MRATVMGKKIGAFVDKKTGERVEYARLYVTAPFEESTYVDAPEVEGVQCLEIKTKPEHLVDIKVGSDIKVYFDQKGKLDEIVPL